MRLVRRGAVAVLLAASLTSGALVGASLAATENDAGESAEPAIVKIMDQDEDQGEIAVSDAHVHEDGATDEEADTEKSDSDTSAADAADSGAEG